MTTDRVNLPDTIEACVRHGIPYIGVWRHKLNQGAHEAVRLIANAGLKVSSLCRGGMFPAATAAGRRTRMEDNFRAVDEAAALGAPVLVLVNGAASDRDIDAARQMVIDGIAELAEYAREAGVKLGIEPLHPMFAAERSVVVTLEQANDIAERFDADRVGVVIDVYHVWWDPNVYREIARATGRILGFHVSDWLVPTPSLTAGRGMMGEGVIEIRRLRQAVHQAGYQGPIEVEIFNEDVWATPVDEVLRKLTKTFSGHV